MNIIRWYLSLSSKAQRVWAFLCLVVGVILSVVLMIAALIIKIVSLLALVVIGTPLALLGNPWWFDKWLLYDRIWNWILGGDIDETVSSRLGKWHFFNHAPVFKGRFYFLNQLVSLWLDQVDKDHIKKSIIPGAGIKISDSDMANLNRYSDSLYSISFPL